MRVLSSVPSTTPRPSAAPITLAPVSPSMSRSWRSSPSSPNDRAHHGGERDAGAVGPEHEHERHVDDEAALDRAPRRAVEQVAEIGRERDQERVHDQAPTRLEAGRGDEDDGDRRACHQLQQAGGDARVPQRAEVTAEAALRPDAGEVVDQPEEAEAEHREQHLAPRE